MILAAHGPNSGSRHICLIIASTGQQGPVLCKGVNDAAHPPEGGPAEAFRPQVCLCWTVLSYVKVNSKLMPSVLNEPELYFAHS